MKTPIIGLAEFESLRRQLTGSKAGLVANLEHAYRAELGVEKFTDDEIVEVQGAKGQTDAERAGLAVIRWCIAFREAEDDGSRDQALDYLAIALAHADPLRLAGILFSKGKPKGAVGEVTRYLRAERRPGETARDLWERLHALGSYDQQPIYFDGDEMVDYRTTKTISFKAFEKRLIVRRRTKRK